MLSLGMDIGTSTVKLVLLRDGAMAKQWMAVHHGRPFACLKKGLSALELDADTPFSLCVTGSNTEALLEQDSAIPSLGDIPAIVEGVRQIVPQAGSVIEIGSQGARFITDLQSRAPQFAVNEHCAGGTGSFFEDQMSRVGCKLEDYSSLVEQAQSIPRLSGRCAVFAKTDIIHRQQEGAATPDILLGLCYAMIRNYKATIVRRLPVCKPVVFCGGVTCNTGVIRAIREVFGLTEEELIVPEFARYEAALGAALKASGSFTLRQLNDSLDRTRTTRHTVGTLPKLELRPGTSLAEPNATKIIPESGCALGIDIGSTSTDLVLVGADGELVDFQYLRTAGDPEGAVRKGLASIRQRFGDIRFTAVGVTGSGRERVGKRIGADAVRDEITAQAKGATHWVPEVDTVFEIGGQDSKYISIQNGEVVDFQMNKICAAGTGSFVEEQAVRMGIPLAEFGPLALSAEHPAALGERCTVFIETAIASAAAEGVSQAEIAAGLCHSIVQNYILSGAKLIAHHPNLYAVYLTNHGCGPDTMLSHLFKQEMGDKPYLQIEVDEHFSNVGVITRIEAFLNSLQHRPAVALPTDFNIEQVDIHPCRLAQTPSPNVPLYLPAMGAYTPYLAAYFKQQGADPHELPHLTDDILSLGRAETSAKEYLPFPALLGSILAERKNDQTDAQFLIPQTQGAEADGQYARVIRAVLDRRKELNAQLISPMLETLPEMAQNRDALFRALLAGDILYAAPADKRADISAQWDALPGWEQLHTAAREIGALPAKGRRIAAVGTPLCLTELDSGVLAALEAEGERVLRAPLSEALWFLWKDNLDDNKPSAGWLDQMRRQMQTLGNELGAHSAFAEDAEALFLIADSALPNFSGGNGRYRYAKAVELSGRTNAVLTLAPRYENTAMILDMRGLHDACRAPLFQLSLDNDWDETAWSRLRSFLYYC